LTGLENSRSLEIWFVSALAREIMLLRCCTLRVSTAFVIYARMSELVTFSIGSFAEYIDREFRQTDDFRRLAGVCNVLSVDDLLLICIQKQREYSSKSPRRQTKQKDDKY
jgi:hypothetical protein